MPPPYFLLREIMKKRTGCKYPTEPKDVDLITPIYRQPSRWYPNRLFYNSPKRWDYLSYFPPFAVVYNLEGGDFEIFDCCGRGAPFVWQKMWLRFRIWRMRRKIRKALQQK